VLTSAPAVAQAPATPPPVADDPRTFRLSGAVQIETEYNDNFNRTERDPQAEFRERLNAPVQFRFAHGGSRAEFVYTPSLVHSSLTEEIQLFHLLAANASIPLTERFTLLATENFRRTDEPAVTDPRGTQRGRTTLLENTVGSSLRYERDTWSLTPRYTYTLIRTQATGATTAGATAAGTTTEDGTTDDASDIHTLGADGTLSILERNRLAATYELTLARFSTSNPFDGHTGRATFSRELTPRMTALAVGSLAYRDVKGGRDYTISRADVGLRRELTALYTVEVRLGYAVLDVAGQRPTGEFAYSFTGTYTGQTFRVTSTSAQSFQETFLEAQNAGVARTRESSAEIAWDLSDRLTLALRGRMAENRFEQAGTATGGGTQERKDVQLGGGIDAALRLTRLLTLTAGYSHTRVDSNLRGLDYQNNLVRVGLSLALE
jgi:hypothetical protein